MSRAEGLVHPVPLVAIAVLLLNDHVLKDLYGNALTGKLSDVAGMVFFPLMLQAMVELVDRREPFLPKRRVLIGCAVATAVVFAATNLFEPAAELYRVGLGMIQWPFRMLIAMDDVELRPVLHTRDPWDLVATPFVLIAVWVGWKRCS